MTSWGIIQLVLQFFRNEISFSSLRNPFRRWYEFKPTFLVLPRRPRNHKEAQAIYNAIRTYAFYLDALPIISDLGINVRIGLDDLLAIPILGDLITGLISIYQIWLASLLGPPRMVVYRMVRISAVYYIADDVFKWINVVFDVLVGLVPWVGAFFDFLFKANLRNLNLVEQWLLSSDSSAHQHRIVLMPKERFLPKRSPPDAHIVSDNPPSRTYRREFIDLNEDERDYDDLD
ncbi:hypothetical protein E3P86_02292 [Wallemia ichthyophaga]|uniref:Uncharacterized protein n=1 Tax=Wallemia ichthyophaga TaxID=245174 RepID=A0A4T0J3A4_WALIC|nr:hypothetical protein E3P86_02292 [Wallemia ichthyophaga]